MNLLTRFFNKYTLLLAVAVAGLTIGLTPVTANAGLFDGAREEACKGAALDEAATCATSGADSTTRVNTVLATALNILSLVVGITAVIVIIISGLRMVLSSGDSNTIASARNALIYAIAGIVIVALAQFIVRFVLGGINKPTPPNQQNSTQQTTQPTQRVNGPQ